MGGYIKDIQNQPNRQTFPTSTFAIAGDVPASQCSEAKIEGFQGRIRAGNDILTEAGKFAGFALTGKSVTVTLPPIDAGTYGITGNNDNEISTDHNFNDFNNNAEYFIHDGGTLILTRDLTSFARFIQSQPHHVTGNAGIVAIGFNTLTEVGNFPDDLTGNILTIRNGAPPDLGDHLILSNTLDVLTTDFTFTVARPDTLYTVNFTKQSASTIKGGTLYTNISPVQLQQACTILFDPLT